jgi:flagellar biosynthesis chaperone FliJ
MREDCTQVDELLRQLADYKNDYADMAAEKLLRKCSTSWDAYRYLLDRVHDVWLPDSVMQRARQIITKIHVQLNQRREYGWTYEGW